MVAAIVVVVMAQLSSAQIADVKASYQKLAPAEVEAKKLDAPPADAEKIDVSTRIRSTSFGHKTWLVVSPDGTRFWIEWGKSTNRPGALFGPFPIVGASGGKAGAEKPGEGGAGKPGADKPGADKPAEGGAGKTTESGAGQPRSSRLKRLQGTPPAEDSEPRPLPPKPPER